MCVCGCLHEGDEFRVCLGSPFMKGPAEPQSEAVIGEDRGEPSRKRNKCMFRMAQTRHYQPTPAYLCRVILATLCSSKSMFQSSIQNHFQSLKTAHLLFPLAFVYVSWYDYFY